MKILYKMTTKIKLIVANVILLFCLVTNQVAFSCEPKLENKTITSSATETDHVNNKYTNQILLEKTMTEKTPKLEACPNSPNCFSSQSDKTQKSYIAPFTLVNETEDALSQIKQIILSMPRTALVKETPISLHITFKSKLFGFVDDVNFILDNGVVQVRSASRLGYSDLGANRKRVEAIRHQLIGSKLIKPKLVTMKGN